MGHCCSNQPSDIQREAEQKPDETSWTQQPAQAGVIMRQLFQATELWAGLLYSVTVVIAD